MNVLRLARALPSLVALPLLSSEPSHADSSKYGSDSGPRAGAVRAALRGLSLPDLKGQPMDLGSLVGRGPLVLDFWAMWCKPCLEALPELNQVYVDLHPRGLELIAINEDGPRNAAKVKPFVRSQGFEFPVVLDLNREAQSRLNALAMPTTLLVDSTGTVVYTAFGYRSGEAMELRKRIEGLLGTPSNE